MLTVTFNNNINLSLMNYDEFINKNPEFSFLKIGEFDNINIFKRETGLILQVSFKYSGKKISVDFINAYNINLHVAGGFIEIGELLIIEKADGYILSDELKGYVWHCDDIQFTSTI